MTSSNGNGIVLVLVQKFKYFLVDELYPFHVEYAMDCSRKYQTQLTAFGNLLYKRCSYKNLYGLTINKTIQNIKEIKQ